MCRFGLKIYIPLPNYEDRSLFLEQRLKKDNNDILDISDTEFELIVHTTEGMSHRGKNFKY